MIKAIIFDKDGTLIDFDAFWISVSENAIDLLLKSIKREDVPQDELLASIGVENGVSDIGGLLCGGTYEEIALAFNGVLQRYGCALPGERIVPDVLTFYNMSAAVGAVKPTCENLNEVLAELKARGVKLAVVTTDNFEITERCLKALGAYHYFDKIYTDDGKTPIKPEPFCALDFCKFCGVDKDEMLMVGDTMTDVRFARNAGIRVMGVGAKAENRARLEPHADAVKHDVSKIFEFIDGVK